MRFRVSQNAIAIAAVPCLLMVYILVRSPLDFLVDFMTPAVGWPITLLVLVAVSIPAGLYLKILKVCKPYVVEIFRRQPDSTPARIREVLSKIIHIEVFEANLTTTRKCILVGTFLIELGALMIIMMSTQKGLYLIVEPIAGFEVMALVMNVQEIRWYDKDHPKRRRPFFVPSHPQPNS